MTTEIVYPEQGTLPELAEKINACVAAAEGHARSALRHALEAGALLNQAKWTVPHGEWADWLARHCVIAPRTAQAYMRLAKHVPALPAADAQRVADLPLRDAIKAIATEPTCTRVSTPAARPPRDQAERDRVVSQLRKTAISVREAARWFTFNMPLKPAKVASLRKKLEGAIAELDRLQQEGGAA